MCLTLDKAQLQRRQGRNKQDDVTLKARRRCIFRKYISIALETVLKLLDDLRWPTPLGSVSFPEMTFCSDMSHFKDKCLTFNMIPDCIGLSRLGFVIYMFNVLAISP